MNVTIARRDLSQEALEIAAKVVGNMREDRAARIEWARCAETSAKALGVWPYGALNARPKIRINLLLASGAIRGRPEPLTFAGSGSAFPMWQK